PVGVDFVQSDLVKSPGKRDTQKEIGAPYGSQRQGDCDSRFEKSSIDCVRLVRGRRNLLVRGRRLATRLAKFIEQARQRHFMRVGEKSHSPHRTQGATEPTQAVSIKHYPRLGKRLQ